MSDIFEPPYCCSINSRLIGKADIAKANKSFKNASDRHLTNQLLFEVKTVAGYAIGPILIDDTAQGSGRTSKNVLGTRIFELDFDNTYSVDEAMTHPLWDYCVGLYSTPSFGKTQEEITLSKALPGHQFDKVKSRVGKPKNNFRMIFRFESMVEAQDITPVYATFYKLFPQLDVSCSDTARLFYGSENAEVAIFNENSALIDDELMALFIKAKGRPKVSQEVLPERLDGGLMPNDREVFTDNVNIRLQSGGTIDCETILKTKPIGWKQSCHSPFRQDRKASAFATITDYGQLLVFDSADRSKRYFHRSIESYLMDRQVV